MFLIWSYLEILTSHDEHVTNNFTLLNLVLKVVSFGQFWYLEIQENIFQPFSRNGRNGMFIALITPWINASLNPRNSLENISMTIPVEHCERKVSTPNHNSESHYLLESYESHNTYTLLYFLSYLMSYFICNSYL